MQTDDGTCRRRKLGGIKWGIERKEYKRGQSHVKCGQ